MSHEDTRSTRVAATALANLYVRAVTRYLETSGFAVHDRLSKEELAKYCAAEQVDFEEIFCTPKAIGRVVIEVLGGVAEVASKPENIEFLTSAEMPQE